MEVSIPRHSEFEVSRITDRVRKQNAINHYGEFPHLFGVIQAIGAPDHRDALSRFSSVQCVTQGAEKHRWTAACRTG